MIGYVEKSRIVEEIKLNGDTSRELQRSYHELKQLSGLIKFYLYDHVLDKDGRALEAKCFKIYHKKYVESFKAYNELLSKLNKYIKGRPFTIDFSEDSILIYQ